MDDAKPQFGRTTHAIIGACIEVHRCLGPGLLESVYEACLAHELTRRGIAFVRQTALALDYKGLRVEHAYQPDLVVEERVIVELKAVPAFHSSHVAQLRTYLRLSRLPVGLLVNFNVPALRQNGIRRVRLSSPPALPASRSSFP